MRPDEFKARFARPSRIRPLQDFPLPGRARPAAVLMPIIKRREMTLLLTQRSAHLAQHAGQISFPGGSQEGHDRSLIDTALRETQEEVGIPPDEVEVLGTLPPFRTISGFKVTPVVGLLPPDLPQLLDPGEVQSAFEVPLAHVLDRRNHRIHWVNRNGLRQPVVFIPYLGYNIWGATAAFIHTLSTHIASD